MAYRSVESRQRQALAVGKMAYHSGGKGAYRLVVGKVAYRLVGMEACHLVAGRVARRDRQVLADLLEALESLVACQL